ncbi:MAG: hypothetical protein DHS80DRAFT_21241 [Piptocephalis tieghemiana]|nr:MAG: hypothetical protein DHS80DRAFT_21241 [Piptocephalis tieghemiana]
MSNPAYQAVPTDPAAEERGLLSTGQSGETSVPRRHDPSRYHRIPYQESRSSRLCKIFCVIPSLMTLIVLAFISRHMLHSHHDPTFTSGSLVPSPPAHTLVRDGVCDDLQYPWKGHPNRYDVDLDQFTGFSLVANATRTITDIQYVRDAKTKGISVQVDAMLSHKDLQGKLKFLSSSSSEKQEKGEKRTFKSILTTPLGDRLRDRCIRANITVTLPESLESLDYLGTSMIQGSLSLLPREEMEKLKLGNLALSSISAPIQVDGACVQESLTIGTVGAKADVQNIRASSLLIETVDGEIQLEDVEVGSVYIRTAAGPIRGKGQVKTGDLEVKATTTSSSRSPSVISFEDARASSIHLASVSGPIAGRYMVSSDFSSKTISGDQALTVSFPYSSNAHEASVNVESIRGAVSVEVEKEFEGDFQVRSIMDKATVEGEGTHVRWNHVGRGRMEGVKGEGHGQIELYSLSGLARLAFVRTA